MYDIIGDIHGYATELKTLLLRLGYSEKLGVWQHPQRKLIFLGDFVDRGPEQVETVKIAHRMVSAGHALAVMGNHEFNAVAWATPKDDQPGEYLRPHSDKNRKQHSAFLYQIGEDSQEHRQAIEWFKTLPLYLDLDGLRVVHACWHPQHIKALVPYLDECFRIRPSAWATVCEDGTSAFVAVETILKGLEIPLPNGVYFNDKDGHARTSTRTRWWSQSAELTYRDLAIVPHSLIEQIPHEPVPVDLQPGYDGLKSLFIGHYWMSGAPTLVTEQIACLDYSIAGDDRAKAKLCAYRWCGEIKLSAENLVWVERES